MSVLLSNQRTHAAFPLRFPAISWHLSPYNLLHLFNSLRILQATVRQSTCARQISPCNSCLRSRSRQIKAHTHTHTLLCRPVVRSVCRAREREICILRLCNGNVCRHLFFGPTVLGCINETAPHYRATARVATTTTATSLAASACHGRRYPWGHEDRRQKTEPYDDTRLRLAIVWRR